MKIIIIFLEWLIALLDYDKSLVIYEYTEPIRGWLQELADYWSYQVLSYCAGQFSAMQGISLEDAGRLCLDAFTRDTGVYRVYSRELSISLGFSVLGLIALAFVVHYILKCVRYSTISVHNWAYYSLKYLFATTFDKFNLPTWERKSIFRHVPKEVVVTEALGPLLRKKRVPRADGKAYTMVVVDSKGKTLGILGKEVTMDATMPEMAVPQSKLMTSVRPKVSVVFYDGDGEIVGNGWRFQQFIVTARHVAVHATWWGSGTSVRFRCGRMRTQTMNEDSAYFKAHPQEFATAGIASAKPARMRVGSYVTVRGFCPGEVSQWVQSKGQIGDARELGLVVHLCSTLPGMSGSPVFVNGKVVGTHVGSSSTGEAINFLHSFELLRIVFSADYYGKLSMPATEIPMENCITVESPEDVDEPHAERIKHERKKMHRLGRYYHTQDADVYAEDDDDAFKFKAARYLEDNGLLEDLDPDEISEFYETGTISGVHGSARVNKAMAAFHMYERYVPPSNPSTVEITEVETESPGSSCTTHSFVAKGNVTSDGDGVQIDIATDAPTVEVARAAKVLSPDNKMEIDVASDFGRGSRTESREPRKTSSLNLEMRLDHLEGMLLEAVIKPMREARMEASEDTQTVTPTEDKSVNPEQPLSKSAKRRLKKRLKASN